MLAVDIERNATQRLATAFGLERQLEVLVADQALLDDLKRAMEQRFGKVLAPGPGMAQGAGQLQIELLDRKLTIGQQSPGQILFLQLTTHLGIEGRGKGAEVLLRQ